MAGPGLGATRYTQASPRRVEAGKEVRAARSELLVANRHLGSGQKSGLATASAAGAGQHLTQIEGVFDAWSVRGSQWTRPWTGKAAELPAWAWSAAAQTVWSDGPDPTAQPARCRHQPGGCERPKPFAVVRRPAADEPFGRRAFVVCPEPGGRPAAGL